MRRALPYLHQTKLCFLPHPDNDHRPLALRHRPLAYVSGLLIASKLLAFLLLALVPATAQLSTITSERIVQLTNAERVKAGLPALKINSQLAAAAQQKGEHMLNEDYFAHISPSGVTPWFWINKLGYTYQVAGENLAIDFFQAEDVVTAWMDSPSHRSNILQAQYQETGVAVVTGDFQGGTSIIVVHMFGKPLISSGVASSVSPAPVATVSAATVSPTPIPSPSIGPRPLDTTPPPPPRLSLPSANSIVRSNFSIRVDGEPHSKTTLLINTQPGPTIFLPENGSALQEISIENLPEGPIVLRATSFDPANNASDLSDPLTVIKDTVSPTVGAMEATFFISPMTDIPRVLVHLPHSSDSTLTFTQPGVVVSSQNDQLIAALSPNPVTLTVSDQAGNQSPLEPSLLFPQFSVATTTEALAVPGLMGEMTRRLSLAIFFGLGTLLLLAVTIRMRLRHPALITHSTLVLFLAAGLFLL